MSEILMVIAQTEFRDEEYEVPRRVFEAAGHHVTVASSTSGSCRGRFGATATADLSVKEAAEKPWDAVVFVGGGGAQVFFDDPEAHRLASDTLGADGVVGAICIAPSILARAGLLKDVRATSFNSRSDDLALHGAAVVDSPVVVDGHIVTGNGPEAASEFAYEIVRLLGKVQSE